MALIEMKGNMLETSPAHDIVVELWRLVDVPENTCEKRTIVAQNKFLTFPSCGSLEYSLVCQGLPSS